MLQNKDGLQKTHLKWLLFLINIICCFLFLSLSGSVLGHSLSHSRIPCCRLSFFDSWQCCGRWGSPKAHHLFKQLYHNRHCWENVLGFWCQSGTRLGSGSDSRSGSTVRFSRRHCKECSRLATTCSSTSRLWFVGSTTPTLVWATWRWETAGSSTDKSKKNHHQRRF